MLSSFYLQNLYNHSNKSDLIYLYHDIFRPSFHEVRIWSHKLFHIMSLRETHAPVEQLMAMIEVFHMQVNRSNCWYPKGGLVMTNRLVKLKAIVLPFQKLWPTLKFIKNWSKSKVKEYLYLLKGLVRYESLTNTSLTAMTKVHFF